MGLLNKSMGKGLADDALKYAKHDGRLHVMVFQTRGKAFNSNGTQFENKVTERVETILASLEDRGCQVQDVKVSIQANIETEQAVLYVITVLYR